MFDAQSFIVPLAKSIMPSDMNLFLKTLLLVALSFFIGSRISHAASSELTALQEQYEKALKERVTNIYETDVQQLTANYFTGVERAIGEARKAGDLPTVLALEEESKRIIKKEPMPAKDDKLVPSLLKLREIYRASLAKLDVKKATNRATVLAPYLVRLKQMEIEFTKGNRLTEAKEIMDCRESLASGLPTKIEPAISASSDGKKSNSLVVGDNVKKWKPVKGEWKFENGTLLGSGASEIDFYGVISTPFVLRFTINVLEGMRPRVKMGDVEFANEGYEKTFGLYPGGKADLFPYKQKTKYAIMIKVSTKATELYIDDKLISSISGIKKKPEYFRFCAGDGWSQGSVEYSEVTLSH